jgi:hypothetical protein
VSNGSGSGVVANVSNVSVTCSDNRFVETTSGTVLDSKTGLTWMRCVVGQTWNGVGCVGSAVTYTASEVSGVATGIQFAGIGSWRVPSIRELITLKKYSSSIDSFYFPNSPSGNYGSSTMPGSNSWWTVNFSLNGGVTNAMPTVFLPLRLVTGVSTLPSGYLDIQRQSSDYTDNGDGTVTHVPTRLMWKKCLEGQVWNSGTSTCDGIARVYDLATFPTTSKFSGYSDWKIPDIYEMETITDYSRIYPAINSSIMLGTPNLQYPVYYRLTGGWGVGVWGVGDIQSVSMGDTYVRLVRNPGGSSLVVR